MAVIVFTSNTFICMLFDYYSSRHPNLLYFRSISYRCV